MSAAASAVTLTSVHGPDILPWLDAAARLRISVFHEWPYLYEGTMEHERDYLRTYAEAPDALMVLARDADGRVVGVSTGVPLVREPESMQAVFQDAGIPPEQVFYFGESVLEPSWRGRGIGVRFFEERERGARALPGIRVAAFCAVDRRPDDPRRPADYVPLDAFWTRRGFTRSGLRTSFTWLEIGEPEPSPKSLTFWTKTLA